MTFDECANVLAKMVYTTSDEGSKRLCKRFQNSNYKKLILKEFVYAKAFLAILVCIDASNSTNEQEVLVVKNLMFKYLKDAFNNDDLGINLDYSELNSRFEHYSKHVEILNNVTREFIGFVGMDALMYPDFPQNTIFIVSVMEITKKWMADNMDKSQNGSSGGCYVATCVYGSYNCPKVWVLRRFRDTILSKTWYGRAFVHFYYKTSPYLVKWFGSEIWFKNACKPVLDTLVDNLKAKGFSDLPYNDKR